MGMYDCLEQCQVKCFYHYFWYEVEAGNGLSSSGGSLNVYRIGDEVPYCRGWYDYTKDFNVVINDVLEGDVIAGIRNGKLAFVKNIAKTSELDWVGIKRCIDMGGKWLRIGTKKDASTYVSGLREYEEKRFNYIKNYQPIHKRYHKLLFGIAKLDLEERESRIKEMDRIRPGLEIEIKEFHHYMDKIEADTIRPYIKDVKPEEQRIKEQDAAYRKVLCDLKNRATNEKSLYIDYRRQIEKCEKEYKKFIDTNAAYNFIL